MTGIETTTKSFNRLHRFLQTSLKFRPIKFRRLHNQGESTLGVKEDKAWGRVLDTSTRTQLFNQISPWMRAKRASETKRTSSLKKLLIGSNFLLISKKLSNTTPATATLKSWECQPTLATSQKPHSPIERLRTITTLSQDFWTDKPKATQNQKRGSDIVAMANKATIR